MRRWRRPMVGAFAVLAGVGVGAFAADQPQSLQMDITGAGAVTVQGRETPIKAVTYVTRSETRRTSYSASLPEQTLTFSGTEDGWTDATHYTLTLDSVVSLSASGVKDLPATGSCQMEISPDATVVRLVQCQAATQAGPYSLRFALGD